MAHYWIYLIFTTVFIPFNAGLDFQCPDGCDCSTYNHALCVNNNFTSIPTNSSMYEIIVFNISSNQIQTLDEKFFFQVNLVNVEVIDLSYNSIYDIRPNAFFGMNNLRELYLQGNKLTNIHPEIFSPLTQLAILDLRYNSIKSFNNKTFESLTHLKNLSLSGLRKFNKDIFNPLKNLTHLQIQFAPNERSPEGNSSCHELYSKAKYWGRENNITVNVACEDIDVHPRRSCWSFVACYSPDEPLTSGGFVIGIVITVGVLLLLITSLVILAVIVRQAERMPEELDDYSYMNDFEPYRGNLSPTKCQGFHWPSSRDNIPKSMQEIGVTPKEDLVTNIFPETVKVDLPQNHRISFKNYS